MQFGKGGIPYIATHDGRTIRYPDPEVKEQDTVVLDLTNGKIKEFIKVGFFGGFRKAQSRGFCRVESVGVQGFSVRAVRGSGVNDLTIGKIKEFIKVLLGLVRLGLEGLVGLWVLGLRGSV